MNFATALLNAREMNEAARLTVVAGTWNVRVALLGSLVDLQDAARYHAKKWREPVDIPGGLQGDTGESCPGC
jgi:hypothetical protein